MKGFPYIFTFYSYKGGVGRSMALLNIAYALAGRGRHVLILDMDLEAPGISNFLDRSNELKDMENPAGGDILDLLQVVINTTQLSTEAELLPDDVPSIQVFARSIDRAKIESLTPSLGKLGRLDVVVADQARDYWERLARLNLASYSRTQLLEFSLRLWHYTKAQRFPGVPLGLEDEDPIETPYDYVLVDSRTGITETGGLCVGPLADRLVVVTGLNEQNVWGTQDFLTEAGVEPRKRTADDEPWDEVDLVTSDQPAGDSLGPKPPLIVASPLPAGEIAYKQRRLVEIAELLGPVAAKLSYHPQMALIESLFVRDYPTEYLAIALS